ncbi:MAG TPA: tRNA preQ1(34) S-adenosylmethionine ribosyltransferase-isomerase QueA, partial [Alphaproteobacteria bacterium]|nr:tRNA preQ1(34) S-adenosylmethionine ribosyltransferase-isomerase QueA [Alphaproteobacteria bacterium]
MSDQPYQLADFNYHLPEELIAQEPARPREAARLLDASGAGLSDHIIADLPNLLRAGDLLVVNNTSVLPAALIGQRGAGRARINLHRRLSADTWLAFAKPAKKCPPRTQITFADGFSAVVTDRAEGGEVTLRFNVSGAALNACLDQHGQMP